MSPPHGELVLSGVSIRTSPNLVILGVKFDIKLTFEDHVLGIVSSVSQRICVLRLVKNIFVDTSEYWSPVWWLSVEYRIQLIERQVCSAARLCPDQGFLSLCHRRHVVGLSMFYKVNSNSNQCLGSELSSASTSVRHT